MQYIDFEGHRYGIYVTYVDAKVKLVLVENKQRVCDLTTPSRYTGMTLLNEGYAYVNVDAIPFAERLMEALGCKKTGVEMVNSKGEKLVDYDVSPLVKFNNREMKRNQMKRGVIQVSDIAGVSTNIAWYIYHTKKDNEYILVTTTNLRYKMTKERFINAVKNYNVPVYKSFRKEPF